MFAHVELAFELIEHLVALSLFLGIAVLAIAQRRTLRRTMRHARLIFWSICGICMLFALANTMCLAVVLAYGLPHALPLGIEIMIECANLLALSTLIIALLGRKIVAERSRRPRRILAIGAHPDDLEIACGATLAKLRDAGHQVCALVLTNGERGGNACVRPREAQRGAQFLGIDCVSIHTFSDTRLREQADEIRAVIEANVREFARDIIFTHSANDQHQDHQAVYEATLRAARNHSTILRYESPSVTRAFMPTFFVDIGDYVDIKIESIKEHWDQHTKPYMSAERVRGTAIFRGGQAKTRYAEGFESVRSLASTLGDL